MSVVVPTYNRGRIIASTLENLLSQTFRDVEIVIVDDGSKDNTLEVLAPFRDRVKVITQENKGITGARNTGIRAARGEWIAMQDSDDEWMPEKLQCQVDDLHRYPGHCVYLTETQLQRNHLGQEVASYEHSGFSKHLTADFTVFPRPLAYQLRYGVAWAQCSLVQKRSFEAAGMYDESLKIFTDVDMFSRLALLGSWGINRRSLVRIKRLADEESYVSSQRTKNPSVAFRSMVHQLERLAARTDLDAEERRIVAVKLAGYCKAVGNELRAMGDQAGARRAYLRSFQVRRGAASALKYVSTLFWIGRRSVSVTAQQTGPRS